MTYEEHPFPEPALLRLGVPIGVAVLTAIVCLALLVLAPGSALTAVVGVALLVQLIGVVARGVYQRRTARPLDRPWLIHTFAWLWAIWSGVPELLPTDHDQAPVERVLFGLAFAVVVTGLLWLAFRPLRSRRDDHQTASGATRNHEGAGT